MPPLARAAPRPPRDIRPDGVRGPLGPAPRPPPPPPPPPAPTTATARPPPTPHTHTNAPQATQHPGRVRSARPAPVDEAAGLTLEAFVSEPRWRPLVENFQARHLVHEVGVSRAWVDFSPEERLSAMGDPFPAADVLPLQFLLDYSPLDLGAGEL